VKKKIDDMNLSYLMRELVIVDSFKIVTLLSTLPLDLDDQVNIITLRNLIYEQMSAKLSSIAARNKLKKEKNEEDKAYSSTSFKNKKKKKTSASLKNDDAKTECSYCKKYFFKSKWTDHTWNECRKLKAAEKKRDKEGAADGSKSEQAALAKEEARSAVSRFSSKSHSAKPTWLFDTGASSHITSNADHILNLKPTQILVRIANDKYLVCEGLERVEFTVVLPNESSRKVVLKRVLYVLSLGRVSLLS
jgi:hypothetical protein